MLLTIIQSLLLLFLAVLALPVLYLLVLTAAAWWAKRFTQPEPGTSPARFAILIPAHNEEKLLPGCLASLHRLDFPSDRCHIWVVADNCTDRTAELARELGANVTERNDPAHLGKGYALQWGLQAIQSAPLPQPAAILILDADSSLSTNFLRVMDARVQRGEHAIQAYYSVAGTERSWSENIRFVALAALHYLRPQGRAVLGCSAGLKGNGMVFSADILAQHGWTTALTEDIEFHMALLLAGEHVTFAPDAVVWGEMPDSLSGAASQVERWERGRVEMARRYVPRLLSAAWQALRTGNGRQAFVLLDAALEHLIPPFAILTGLCGLGLIAAVILYGIFGQQPVFSGGSLYLQNISRVNLIVSATLAFGMVIYVFSGLWLAQAPASAYRALLYAPVFIGWKFWQFFRLFRSNARLAWVRTARNGG